MRVHVDVDGQLPYLDGLLGRVNNLRPGLADAGVQLRRLFGRVINQRGRPAGVIWPAPTRKYAAFKAERRPGPQGVFAGLLYRSLTAKRARYSRERITSDSVTVASKAPHAHLFDKGRDGQRARRLRPTAAQVRAAGIAPVRRYLLDETSRRKAGLL